MKKTAILLMAVISLCPFGGTPLKAYAEAPAAINTDAYVEENIFFTDFDSYKIGSEATEDKSFTGRSLNDGDYGLIQPNTKYETTKKSMKAASDIGSMKGTCMEFTEGQDWQNIQIPLNLSTGMTGRILISFDFFTSKPWGRTQIITELSSSQISGNTVQLIENENYKKTISTNKWHNIALYIDTDASKYSVFADGVKIGSADTTSKNGTLKYFKLQVLDGAISRYIDNVYIRKVDAEPEENIYSTDFDSYRIGLGATVKDTMLNRDLSAMYGTEQVNITHAYNVDGTTMTGVKKDEDHGTSLRFSEGDWRNANVILPQTDNVPMTVSFDFNMAGQGTMRMFGNDASNYGAVFKGTTLETKLDDTTTDNENVIQVGTWAHIEIYVDNPNSKYIMYVDGKKIGGENPFTKAGTLTTLQFQKRSGGVMFIDNLKVKYADTKLYFEEKENEDKSTGISVVYGAPEEAYVFTARYNSEGRLDAIYPIKGESGRIDLGTKVENATYRAFLWDENNAPLRSVVEK